MNAVLNSLTEIHIKSKIYSSSRWPLLLYCKHQPVWSSGKKDVCRQMFSSFHSSVIKCTVKLMYGCIVRLDHRSVVAEKKDAHFSLADTSSFVLSYSSTKSLAKYLRPGSS